MAKLLGQRLTRRQHGREGRNFSGGQNDHPKTSERLAEEIERERAKNRQGARTDITPNWAESTTKPNMTRRNTQVAEAIGINLLSQDDKKLQEPYSATKKIY